MTTRIRNRSEEFTGPVTAPPAGTTATVDEREQVLERASVREGAPYRREEKGQAETTGQAGTGVRGEWFRSSDQTGMTFVRGQTFGPKRVEFSVVDGIRLFEGDIALGTDDTPAADVVPEDPAAASARGLVVHGVGITGEQFRWPGGRVPFEIDPGVPAATAAVITDALNHWHANTHIRLVPRTASDQNFVRFVSQNGCWSYVGMRGGMQEISIGAGCGFGAAVHEIAHAVGLWHEQSREDRDRNVRIRWENIQPGREHNFNQHIADGDDIGNYDFASIMHYGPFAFSRNGLATIETLNGEPIGQRDGLSANDIAAVRALYPQLEPPPQTTRLFRYWNGRTGDHFYTTDWSELGSGRGNYTYEGVQCYIHPAPATGSTPLFRYWNAKNTDHFYTTNWSELRAGRSGYQLEGIQGYVYARQRAGTIPLHRYWNARAGDHFYTTSWAELGPGRDGWAYEGVQCYVYATPPAQGEEASGASLEGAVTNRLAMLVPEFNLGAGELKEGTNGNGLTELTPIEAGTTSFALESTHAEGPSTTGGRAITIRVDLDRS